MSLCSSEMLEHISYNRLHVHLEHCLSSNLVIWEDCRQLQQQIMSPLNV